MLRGGGGGRLLLMHLDYNHIISLENLYLAWREFVRGKKNKKDVGEFALNLSANIYDLHLELKNQTYIHGSYESFQIFDPKPRQIHKAIVRDRLVHHAVYRILYLKFRQEFIHDSYSCQLGKGTHRALNRFKAFIAKASANNTKICWVLKCDVRKFFASIDQKILLEILKHHISDQKIIWLLQNIISSFYSTQIGKGLPLGNLTSQLLVNIYLNEFDQFIKRYFKIKYYVRYADDFVILSRDKQYLVELVSQIEKFLNQQLKLQLHPDKVFLQTIASGVDFLGWVNFSNHRVLRTATKRRMFKRLEATDGKPEVAQSYLGMLSHGNSYKLEQIIVQK